MGVKRPTVSIPIRGCPGPSPSHPFPNFSDTSVSRCFQVDSLEGAPTRVSKFQKVLEHAMSPPSGSPWPLQGSPDSQLSSQTAHRKNGKLSGSSGTLGEGAGAAQEASLGTREKLCLCLHYRQPRSLALCTASTCLCTAPSLADGLTAPSALRGNSLLDLLCLFLPRDTAGSACHRIPASGTVPGSE